MHSVMMNPTIIFFTPLVLSYPKTRRPLHANQRKVCFLLTGGCAETACISAQLYCFAGGCGNADRSKPAFLMDVKFKYSK